MHTRQDVAAPAQPKDNAGRQIAASHPHHIEEMAELGDPIAMHAIEKVRELLAPKWAPLEKLCPPGLCEQFMFMGVVDGIHLYKHVDSRRYLNVDASGATYAYDPAICRYIPISVAAAMRSLGEDEFLGTRRADLEKLFRRFEIAARQASKGGAAMTPSIPIGCFARLAAARARRRPSAELQTQNACNGRCVLVPREVWTALECAYPDFPVEGAGRRQVLAARFAPLMGREAWRFCRCYRAGRPEHRFIARLVDTEAANAAADALIDEEAAL